MLPAPKAPGAALTGPVYSARRRVASANAATPGQQAASQAAAASAVQRPAGINVSGQLPASTCSTSGLGRASAPAAGQTQLGQNVALGGAGWRPAAGRAATHISLKGTQPFRLPKRVVAIALDISCDNGSPVPHVISLHLLAPGYPRLCTVKRTRSQDGLSIPGAAQVAMQQEQLQRAAPKRPSSADTLLQQLEKRGQASCPDILVLQQLEWYGVLSPLALGIGLLARCDATPAIRAEADFHADATLVRQHACSTQPSKRRRLAPAAEPAAQAAASPWLTLDGSPHSAAATAAIPQSGDSIAAPAAADPLQLDSCTATPRLAVAADCQPHPSPRQQEEYPAVQMSPAPASKRHRDCADVGAYASALSTFSPCYM